MMVIEHPQRMSHPKMVTRSDAGGTRMEHWSLFSSSGKDPLEPFTTVSFPVVKFNSSQKPFVAFGYVPIAAIEDENLRVCTGPIAVARK
jgi:hypothetical protein